MGDESQAYTRESLRPILDILPVPVLVFDHGFSIALANHAAVKFTGKDLDLLMGHPAGDALDCVNRNTSKDGCGFGLNCSECRLRATLTETLTTGHPRKRVENAMTLRDKGTRILRFSTLPISLSKETAVLLTIEDLTEARRYEAEHIENEKLAAVLETTGGISHELSQPLQVIMGYCDILSEQKRLSKETRHAVTVIGREVEKLGRLSHALTNITRFETKPYLTSKIIDILKSSEPSPGNNGKT